MLPLVLDTNIVLDAYVFADEAARPLRAQLDAGHWRWLATAAMREELRRVLDYPQLAPRLAFHGLQSTDVLLHFDSRTSVVDTAPKAPVTCKDPDDQKFIDLAVAHGALLLSKDRAVTSMRKRLALHGVVAATVLPA
ncbi:putative toxin-antitoxin system toxin component, PIN family [Ramlibacter humi]|uniref:Putative toxin-antitoxin system toxin component, PIN family n=1 Tax=Ramlibacter humi TaxID=2530451 RepID=A0A4Z0BR09_9BURK|nr:putative toxin-antitoxin system toxin component, PIN family [Ramlibacter humi]TFZ01737.1 putative toxin-antitoxin system toxin component, PIN family [Ramlibacter humi]